MPGFLERFYDPELQLPDGLDRKTIETEESARLERLLTTVVLTGSLPRRLGGDATGDELALDKRRSRRVGHALSKALAQWQKRLPALKTDEEISRAAAQMDWAKLGEDLTADVSTRLCRAATWAIQNDERRWGKSAVVKLENEINWVTYALRD